MKYLIIFVSLIVHTQCFAFEKIATTLNLKDTKQKAILVTGASSGIGRNITEKLSAAGHFVYAGARKQADIEALSKLPNVQGIRLDVTVQTDIDNAVRYVREQKRGLYGLVNNAGVTVFSPLIEVSERDMQFQMDVNLFGPYRITKAFAPLIIESRGRITTTGSIAGIVAGQMLGPYNMSKFAVEGFTDSLAAEMKKFDVQVSVIEPGNYNSKVISNMKKRMDSLAESNEGSRYKKEMARLWTYFTEDRSNHQSPNAVSQAVLHALFSEKPKSRYMVVPVEREAKMTIKAALKKVIELNHGQQFSYDEATLVSMLKEQITSSQ